jgi:hypothetical protein
MSTIHLEEPLTAGGIQAINFFNGRLLSGEDLSHEQAMNLLGQRRLGQTIGTGVAFGLEVEKSATQSTASNPVLTIKRGLALNLEGQTLWVQNDVELAIVRSSESAAASGKVFSDCAPSASNVSVSGDGVYLLVIAPAKEKEGKAPVSGLGNVPAACNSRYTTLGVQFRLLDIGLTAAELADHSRLRNYVAYRVFAPEDMKVSAFLNNPFNSVPAGYGILDEMIGGGLTACDVPLALVSWTAAAGIRFVDLWAVRRSIVVAPQHRWSVFVSPRRTAEAEAMFLQFCEQLREIRETEDNLAGIVGAERFSYLPPVGILPLIGAGGAAGIDPKTFFAGQAVHPPVYIEGVMVEPLVRTAFDYRPISLAKKEPIRLFQIVEGANARPYLIFATAYLPFFGDARFDISRFDFSNFA